MQRLKTRTARRPIEAARDSQGVPHVWADSWPDALYGLGYVQALDRRTQILFGRIVAQGRSAELLDDSPAARERDRFFLRAGLELPLAEEAAALPAERQQELQAFADGVNDGLAAAGRSIAMRAVRLKPQPWTIEAVMLMGSLLTFGGLALGQQRAERTILDLILSGVDPERLKELHRPYLDEVDFGAIHGLKTRNHLSDSFLESLGVLPFCGGSNAWAISAAKSASGGAMLAADPHLEIGRLPATWHEAVLHWQGRYMMGAALPGTPMFAVARHDRLAWGVTYSMADTSDFFIEDCRTVEGRVQYRRGEAWHDFKIRSATIQGRKDGAENVTVYTSDVGTLEGDPKATGDGSYLALGWSGKWSNIGEAVTTWLRLPNCSTVRDGMDLVRNCQQPPLVWLFADQGGHIGQQMSGRVPRRSPGVSGLAPVPAWRVDQHWQGWIPPEDLPQAYDPPCGYIVTANEDLNTPGQPHIATLPAADYRYRRLTEMVADNERVTRADCQAMQYDVTSLQARDLLAIFLPHIPAGPWRSALETWDQRFTTDSREATVFMRFYLTLLSRVFGQDVAAGGVGHARFLYLTTQAPFTLVILNNVDRILKDRNSAWWAGRGPASLLSSLTTAPPATTWGAMNWLTLRNVFLDNALGGWLGLHVERMPLAGCNATPHQGHIGRLHKSQHSYAPSYHFIADMGTPHAWTNLPGGPSEKAFSKWYKSDLKLWLRGEYKVLDGHARRE